MASVRRPSYSLGIEPAARLFGGFTVILAVPVTAAVATLVDVLVLGHNPRAAQPRRSLGPRC